MRESSLPQSSPAPLARDTPVVYPMIFSGLDTNKLAPSTPPPRGSHLLVACSDTKKTRTCSLTVGVWSYLQPSVVRRHDRIDPEKKVAVSPGTLQLKPNTLCVSVHARYTGGGGGQYFSLSVYKYDRPPQNAKLHNKALGDKRLFFG